MMKAEKIRIADLHHPVLSPLQKQYLEAASANPVVISEDSILGAARAATGLDDFGPDPDDFRGRLRLWCESINASTNLTDLGRAGLYAEMLRYASNRLRVEDCIKRHPEILDIVIDRPLIVAGLPRSGTTYLQNFLSADQRLRSLPHWEAMQPVPTPGEPTDDVQRDPRYLRAAKSWEQADALLPYIKAVHPFDPDHISEDTELQCYNYSSYHLEWLCPHPTWADHYWASDHTSTYQYLKRVLRVLTWHRGPNRWLMKSPQHMEQLVPLLKVFPDATVVINHRDPVASIQSAITSLSYSARTRTKTVDADGIARYWIGRYEKLLGRCVRDRDQIPESQVHDVYFHELMANPMETVEEIYAKAGLLLDAPLRERINQFLAHYVRGKHGTLDYNLRRDFGLEPAEIRKCFDFYMKRFPVKVEIV
jgi:hypothetical protein